MTTQTLTEKIAALENLILDMGNTIRFLDENNNYCEYWANDGDGSTDVGYVPALEEIKRKFPD